MRSHEYHLRVRDWIRALAPTLVVLTGLAAVLNTTDRLGLMPRPHHALDPHTTVLTHQCRAAQSRSPAEMILLGDSSCMLDVDAAVLSRQLPGQPHVLNLALIIWFDFTAYADLLSDFVAANPGQLRTVVILITPRKLATGPEASQAELFQQYRRAARRQDATRSTNQPPGDWLGAGRLRRNLLSHCLATPLRGKGEGVAYFGFSSEVDSYLSAHQGSLLEFGQVVPPKRTEPLIPGVLPELEAQTRWLRSRIPAGVKLVVGFTPLSQSHSTPEERLERPALLSQWNAWLNADVLLTNLPAVMPDASFASSSHLNKAGQEAFTTLLARELAPVLEQPNTSRP